MNREPPATITTTTTNTTNIETSTGINRIVIHQWGFYLTVAITVLSFLVWVIGSAKYGCSMQVVCVSVVFGIFTFGAALVDIILRLTNFYTKIPLIIRSALVNIIIYSIGSVCSVGCAIGLFVQGGFVSTIFMAIFNLAISSMLFTFLSYWVKMALSNGTILIGK